MNSRSRTMLLLTLTAGLLAAHAPGALAVSTTRSFGTSDGRSCSATVSGTPSTGVSRSLTYSVSASCNNDPIYNSRMWNMYTYVDAKTKVNGFTTLTGQYSYCSQYDWNSCSASRSMTYAGTSFSVHSVIDMNTGSSEVWTSYPSGGGWSCSLLSGSNRIICGVDISGS